MSDWDGPTPSDSGYTRRQVIAGGVAGLGAITIGGAYATGRLTDERRTYSQLEGSTYGLDVVDIRAGTPVVATATVTTDFTESFEPEITVAIVETNTETAVVRETDTGSVTTRDTIAERGTYYFGVEVGRGADFTASLKDQQQGLF